ncbi:hypothetical protein, conserved [Trypanosoma brucei gambiense DAL972]|uniref:Gamma carbonic dehydratase n=2 Tax=Trypanosoma brucei TaxID=5691 RepID=Q384U9_TRYB2|nr:hypothetical protein, conserved [Trypanosoma brucei gambiense DAL972]XP_828794.1 hypothetical protein, conserved [Trypanosoma brucei brucei TREU927]EAN79682.1 hypothetical protein, conserved [Trypanosoma brucei brucei TREU927]CBH17698.1 hypothetical protein, conserved [Trypanosoma brucei gambiense DAL972]|eukprot:XP_011779962.1 hypothetical protein, conserved [Trypanosoma brucei gambiense DAL972]
MKRCRLALAEAQMPAVLPDWAVKKPTKLALALDRLATKLSVVSRKIISLSDALMGVQPREALNCVPRLLAVNGVRPTVMDNVFIAPSAFLSGDVRVGRKNYIGYNAIVRAERGETIYFGESCNVQEKAIVTGGTTIGKWTTIEPMAIVDAADIASCSFVGANAIVMRDAKIESGSMLCAASVLQSGAVIPSGEMWAGNPAEKVRDLTEKEQDDMIKAAKHMVLLAIEHRDSWELTWEELEDQREAREQFARYAENNREVRTKPMYIKEPPRPSRKAMSRKTPQEMVDGGEHKPPLAESIQQGY